MSNDWLKAYEAQKAAVMQKMNAPKTVSASGSSVSGMSKCSGMVNIDDVKHLSKRTQVTKIMENLKKKNTGSTKTNQLPSQAATKLWAKTSDVPPQPVEQGSYWDFDTTSKPKLIPPAPADHVGSYWDFETSTTTKQDSANPLGVTTPSKKKKKKKKGGATCSNVVTNLGFSASSLGGTTSVPIEVQKSPVTSTVVAAPIGAQKKKNKKKNKNSNSSTNVLQLIKRVKCDANKKSTDWQEEYEKRKRQTIENIAAGKVETRIGSMSAFHAGALLDEQSSNPQSIIQSPPLETKSSMLQIKTSKPYTVSGPFQPSSEAKGFRSSTMIAPFQANASTPCQTTSDVSGPGFRPPPPPMALIKNESLCNALENSKPISNPIFIVPEPPNPVLTGFVPKNPVSSAPQSRNPVSQSPVAVSSLKSKSQEVPNGLVSRSNDQDNKFSSAKIPSVTSPPLITANFGTKRKGSPEKLTSPEPDSKLSKTVKRPSRWNVSGDANKTNDNEMGPLDSQSSCAEFATSRDQFATSRDQFATLRDQFEISRDRDEDVNGGRRKSDKSDSTPVHDLHSGNRRSQDKNNARMDNENQWKSDGNREQWNKDRPSQWNRDESNHQWNNERKSRDQWNSQSRDDSRHSADWNTYQDNNGQHWNRKNNSEWSNDKRQSGQWKTGQGQWNSEKRNSTNWHSDQRTQGGESGRWNNQSGDWHNAGQNGAQWNNGSWSDGQQWNQWGNGQAGHSYWPGGSGASSSTGNGYGIKTILDNIKSGPPPPPPPTTITATANTAEDLVTRARAYAATKNSFDNYGYGND